MADFQTRVNMFPARGVPGAAVAAEGVVYTAFNYISDGTVSPGTFAFGDAQSTITNAPQVAHATVASDAKLLGFVVRVNGSFVNTPFQSVSNVYYKGSPVTIAVRGQFYLQVPEGGAPTEGQAVLCDPATGAITFGDAGAANDTGWIVHLPQGVGTAEGGDIVYIEHLGAQTAAASAPGVGG